MTEAEKQEINKRAKVKMFLKENKMDAFDLAKIAKQLCVCGTCYFFCQHYTKDGECIDWGHCFRGNIQHSKKVSTSSCGYWRDKDENI